MYSHEKRDETTGVYLYVVFLSLIIVVSEHFTVFNLFILTIPVGKYYIHFTVGELRRCLVTSPRSERKSVAEQGIEPFSPKF